MLTVHKFSKTAVAALVSGLVGLGAAHAAVVASYTVEVEGSLNEVDFGSAFSFNQATNAFQQVNQAVYTNPADLHVAAPWAGALGATTGGLTVNIDEHGQASYAGCSGILSAMCNGNVALFDEAAQSLHRH